MIIIVMTLLIYSNCHLKTKTFVFIRMPWADGSADDSHGGSSPAAASHSSSPASAGHTAALGSGGGLAEDWEGSALVVGDPHSDHHHPGREVESDGQSGAAAPAGDEGVVTLEVNRQAVNIVNSDHHHHHDHHNHQRPHHNNSRNHHRGDHTAAASSSGPPSAPGITRLPYEPIGRRRQSLDQTLPVSYSNSARDPAAATSSSVAVTPGAALFAASSGAAVALIAARAVLLNAHRL
jgi:hypothetical protein